VNEHVLKKGECPICDASEFQSLRTRLAESEAEVGRLRDTLEAVTECEEHRPCGLCRERVRRAVEVKP
jgi:hypothetical protein